MFRDGHPARLPLRKEAVMAELSRLVVVLVNEDDKVVARRDIAVGTTAKLQREKPRWSAVAAEAAALLRAKKPEAVAYRLKMVDF